MDMCSAYIERQSMELYNSSRRIPQRVVTSFTIQTSDGACRIPATIFVTKKGFKLCAPFPSENNWVNKLINDILARPVRKPKGIEKARALPQAYMEESGFVFVVSSFLINQLMHVFRGPGCTTREEQKKSSPQYRSTIRFHPALIVNSSQKIAWHRLCA
ncbi:unnamed protein product [Leuciscus chuanchicus]